MYIYAVLALLRAASHHPVVDSFPVTTHYGRMRWQHLTAKIQLQSLQKGRLDMDIKKVDEEQGKASSKEIKCLMKYRVQ